MVDAIRCLGSTISHHIIEDTCPGLPNEGEDLISEFRIIDRKSTRLNSSHSGESRMPSSA